MQVFKTLLLLYFAIQIWSAERRLKENAKEAAKHHEEEQFQQSQMSTGEELRSYEELRQKLRNPMHEYDCRFQPGEFGELDFKCDRYSGKVEVVDEGGQADRMGVEVGWRIVRVAGIVFSEPVLRDYCRLGHDFDITFNTWEDQAEFIAIEGYKVRFRKVHNLFTVFLDAPQTLLCLCLIVFDFNAINEFAFYSLASGLCGVLLLFFGYVQVEALLGYRFIP
jgi:hypothetical protein